MGLSVVGAVVVAGGALEAAAEAESTTDLLALKGKEGQGR